MMKRSILIIILIFSCRILFSQDAILSQYNSFPLYNNMAMAGSAGCSRVVMGTRLQWLNLDGGYKTYYFSYDQYSRHLGSGIGLQYYHNDEGNGMIQNDFLHFVIAPTFSFGKRDSVTSLRKFIIKPTLNFGLLQYKFDWNKYTWGDQIDPLYGFIYGTLETKNVEKVWAPDFGAGISTYSEKFFGGLYFHHITQPDVAVLTSSSPLSARMVLNGGYLLKGYDWMGKLELVPSFIYEKQAGMTRTELTIIGTYDLFSMGISGRFGSAIVYMAGFHYRFFKVGYASDFNLTHARRAVGSTHEIMLGFNFACRKKLKGIRTLDFPSM